MFHVTVELGLSLFIKMFYSGQRISGKMLYRLGITPSRGVYMYVVIGAMLEITTVSD